MLPGYPPAPADASRVKTNRLGSAASAGAFWLTHTVPGQKMGNQVSQNEASTEGRSPLGVPSLQEPFAGPALPPQLRWHCEPGRWSLHPAERCLRIEPDAGTDFWRRTHYGFEADN